MVITILLFILILGLLVFVHELGHFLTARFFGVKAEEFGFGFPPRAIGMVYDDAKKRYRLVGRKEHVESPHTIYSLNWLPLGGFVRIKGEDGNEHEPDSFVSQTASKRIAILAAGVVMNMIMAVFLFAAVFYIGVQQPIDEAEKALYPNAKIQILDVKADSLAATMGIEPGDALLKINQNQVATLAEVSEAIKKSADAPLIITVERLGEQKRFVGTPVKNTETGEVTLGVAFSHTATVKTPLGESFTRGFVTTGNVTMAILGAFGKLIAGIFTDVKPVGVDLTGPVGIVYITKQMSDLGLVYILQFAALLSVNLAIINALPIPALDGGRILFVLIEKLKGSPVRRSTEGMVHQIGFLLLIFLMVFITTRDILKFELFQKFTSLFG
jgi:regulator of sigma E protease